MEEEIYSSLLMCSSTELSARECQSLIGGFGDAAGAWKAGPQNWGHFIEVDADRIHKISREVESSKTIVAQTLEKISKDNIQVYLSHQGPYPDRLRHRSFIRP